MKHYKDHKAKNEESVVKAIGHAKDDEGRFLAWATTMLDNGQKNLAEQNDATADELRVYFAENFQHIAATLAQAQAAIFLDGGGKDKGSKK